MRVQPQAMTENRLNPEQQNALARLKCAHCQSLMNCDALAQAVLAELQSRFRIDCRPRNGNSQVSNCELVAGVRAGIDHFLAESMDDAA